METFILATVSLIIATSLFINKTKNEKKITFALLCTNLAVIRRGAKKEPVFGNRFSRDQSGF